MGGGELRGILEDDLFGAVVVGLLIWDLGDGGLNVCNVEKVVTTSRASTEFEGEYERNSK